MLSSHLCLGLPLPLFQCPAYLIKHIASASSQETKRLKTTEYGHTTVPYHGVEAVAGLVVNDERQQHRTDGMQERKKVLREGGFGRLASKSIYKFKKVT